MKVAFNITPLKSGHKNRGIGFYCKNILENLKLRDDIEVIEFEDITKVKDVDIVHYPWFDLFFRTLPLRQKFPTVVTVHDVIPLIFKKQFPVGIRGKINFNIQKLSLRKCNIITVSETSKKDIVKFLKVPEEKIEVIYNGVSKDFRILSDGENLKIKRKYNLHDRFIMYVGDADHTKNLPFLIEGFKKTKEIEKFKDLKLVLIGGVFLKKIEYTDNPELKSLREVLLKIKDYNLEADVLKLGQIETDELVSIYNLAQVYVQPSLYEGFGLPILEAFSSGTPVLSSNTAALKEIGGQAVIYFDPENLDQLTRLLGEILESRSLQTKLSKLGLQRVKNFSWSQSVNQTIKVYEKAIRK